MAVSDTTVILLASIFIVYITVYQRMRFIGDLFFLSIGATTYFIVSGESQLWGLIIMFASLIDMVYNLFFNKG